MGGLTSEWLATQKARVTSTPAVTNNTSQTNNLNQDITVNEYGGMQDDNDVQERTFLDSNRAAKYITKGLGGVKPMTVGLDASSLAKVSNLTALNQRITYALDQD